MNVPVPSVSVGVPVFNGKDFLGRALDSILAQTHADFELIISDNASDDGTPEIIQHYAAHDSRIRYFRQAKNIGVANNWSFVARQARGRYFKWASANDEYAPELLRTCLEVMRGDNEVVVCYGRTRFINEQGSQLEVYGGDFDALDPDPLVRYSTVRRKLDLGTPIQGGVVRLDGIKRYGYLGNYRDSDRILIAGLALYGKIVLLPQILFFRRWGKAVSSSLRTPLEMEQMFRFDATRPPVFVNLRRHAGHMGAVMRAPLPLRLQLRCLVEALRFATWEREGLVAEFREFLRRLVRR